MITLIENAGYIYGSYALTFGVVGAFGWRVIRLGRRLADDVDDADKYWT